MTNPLLDTQDRLNRYIWCSNLTELPSHTNVKGAGFEPATTRLQVEVTYIITMGVNLLRDKQDWVSNSLLYQLS